MCVCVCVFFIHLFAQIYIKWKEQKRLARLVHTHRNDALMVSIFVASIVAAPVCILLVLSYQFIFDALFIYVVFGSLFQSLAFDRFGAIF